MKAKTTKLIGVLVVSLLALGTLAAAIKTLTVQETDFVQLQTKSTDLDNDPISYHYSYPLNAEGEWQTDYDDAGAYVINVTASDGVNEVTEKVQLVVTEKNQPPVLTENHIMVKETQTVDLKSVVQDGDGDVLSYTFHAPFNAQGKWETGYDDAGTFITSFTVSDGKERTELWVEVEVLNTNQPPNIVETFAETATVAAKEGVLFAFSAEATDLDNDTLWYQWTLDGDIISNEPEGAHEFNYESAGEHLLQLTVKDSQLAASKEWSIHVANTNRPPKLSHLPVTVPEGETVALDLPETDVDGDQLTFHIAPPLNQDGQWQTDHEDAGEYIVQVTASDGELEDQIAVKITVLDVDREPLLAFPATLEVSEGESLRKELDAEDPDGDIVTVTISNAPAEARLEGNIFSWSPDYDTISRNGGVWSDVLNYVRLEHYFLRKKIIPLEIKACGKDKCSSKQVDLIVHNVNRPPVLDAMENMQITETERLELQPLAQDPDQDRIRYSFSEPLGKRSGAWKTGYEDAGNYTLLVTASDGDLSSTTEVHLEVLPANRQPHLEIDDDQMKVNEGEAVAFAVGAEDPDGDKLDLYAEDLPGNASFRDGLFRWEPGYDTVTNKTDSWWNKLVSSSEFLNRRYSQDKEVVQLKFAAADQGFEVVHPVKITVKNVNRPPEMVQVLPNSTATITAGQPLLFQIDVQDPDQDMLTYRWDFGSGQEPVEGAATVQRTFVTSGTKQVKVIVSDGREEVEQEWTIDVTPRPVSAQPLHLQEPEPFTVGVYVIKG